VICASDLIGCQVESESGKRLGRVHDLRAREIDGGWELIGLVVGRRGIVVRLIGDSGGDPLVRGEVISWEAVAGLEEGLVIVRAGHPSSAVRSATDSTTRDAR
jgi:sporulation protein YlmC with PRC-barrel domain